MQPLGESIFDLLVISSSLQLPYQGELMLSCRSWRFDGLAEDDASDVLADRTDNPTQVRR